VNVRRLLLAACLGASLFSVRCAKAPIHVDPPLPELVPPPPPPRIIAVYASEVEEPSPALGPAPSEESAQPAPPPAPRPKTSPEGEITKTEPARVEPDLPKPPSAPALTLKPLAGTEAKTEASIRNLLAQASRDLGRVNASTLDSDGKTQFNTARRFQRQAEEALKSGNLVFAGKLADKAATLAAVLVR
jgi:hypothetical protein